MSAQPSTLAAPPGPITLKEWGALEMPPFYELVDGRLQEIPGVALWHDILLVKLIEYLSAYVTRQGLGYLAGPTTRLEISALRGRMPDLFLIRKDQVQRAGKNVFHGIPPWAAEVLSPTTEHIDRTEKRDEYARLGIAHYWLIDFPNRVIEIYELHDLPNGGRAYELTETIRGEGLFRPSFFPGLEIPLSEVWPTEFENRTDE